MGGSEKLSPLGPDRYRYAEHRDYLFALWDSLDLGDRVVLVLDDWGAVLGLNWVRENSQRVQGIVHMEAVAAPLNWSDLPEQVQPFFKALLAPHLESRIELLGGGKRTKFNMLGRYHFAVPEGVLRGELRPLRDLNDADEELLIA
jgi:pimeloyl-ACP methyl ester carboxylesterase